MRRTITRRLLPFTLLPAVMSISLLVVGSSQTTRITSAACGVTVHARLSLPSSGTHVERLNDGAKTKDGLPAGMRAALLETLRRGDAAATRDAYLRFPKHRRFEDETLVLELLAVARDPLATESGRVVALELLHFAIGADEETVAKVREIALASDLDTVTRTRAIDLLRTLSLGRQDLEAPIQAALVDAASQAPSSEARALALSASGGRVERVGPYLADADASVRASAARSLATSPASTRDVVTRAVGDALARESDPIAASAMIETTLRVACSDADACLARASQAPLVRANAGLQRQVTDYRSSLERGETDSQRVQAEHLSREMARAH